MKIQSKTGIRRSLLKLLHYGNTYYIERAAELEALIAKRPKTLQIDLVGEGEIPADTALLIRSILRGRSPETKLETNARSSLQNSSVLVWLMGDRRIIREHARIYFRRPNMTGVAALEAGEDAGKDSLEYADSHSEPEPDEADYVRVLELINEFLPVKELAGRILRVPELKQFGLVENEHWDQFLATAFGLPVEVEGGAKNRSKRKRVRARVNTDGAVPSEE